jgi:hypothetical protein
MLVPHKLFQLGEPTGPEMRLGATRDKECKQGQMTTDMRKLWGKENIPYLDPKLSIH